MINFSDFYQAISADLDLQIWLNSIPNILTNWKNTHKNIDFLRLLKAIDELPNHKKETVDLKNRVFVDQKIPLNLGEKKFLESRLRKLIPWKKGPFDFFGVFIDTEWRSDFKWDRLIPHISNLEHRKILDVGCGSGYHLWRMLGENAKFVLGIDPTSLFFAQFLASKKLIGKQNPVHFLPLGIEDLPKSNAFDSVFSMGVLYHRRSPLDHLIQLNQQLKKNGELILETLVIKGKRGEILVPENTYAKMPNVYFIPSVLELENWLRKCGFYDCKLVDLSQTNFEEQRKTDWIENQSLEDFLDSSDLNKTIEGLPAPLRAVFIAKKS